MERDIELVHGAVYRTADTPHKRLQHMSGIPRVHWNVTRDHVTFRSFRQSRLWREHPDEWDFNFKDQSAIYDGILGVLGGTVEGSWSDYAGLTAAITSPTTHFQSEAAAALISNALLTAHNRARVCWIHASDRDKWGRPIGIDRTSIPDLVVVTGLTPEASYEKRETVERVHDWAIRHCLCLLVGAGADPIEMAIKHYRIKPSMVFNVFSLQKEQDVAIVRTFG